MLRSLELLQNGIISSRSFQYAITTDRLFDLELSNHCKLQEQYSGGINCLDIDRVEERFLLSGSKDGSVCIHDLQNDTGRFCHTSNIVCRVRRQSRYAHKYSVETVQWHPFDTGLFTSSGMDCVLKIWDTNSLKPADKIHLGHKIFSHNVSFIATHSLIAAAMHHPHVLLIDPISGAKSHELRAHRGHVTCVRWSPLAEHLLATGGTDNKIFLWDIRSAKGHLSTFDQHNGVKVSGKKDVVTAHNGIVNCIRFTDDGLYMMSYGTDSRIRLWDVATCCNTYVNFGLVANNHEFRQRGVAISCDSNPPTVFVPSSNYIYAYDLFTGLKLRALVGHYSFVNSCAYRSTTHQLYTAGSDMNILLWTPDVERELLEDSALGRPIDRQRSSPIHSDNWSDDD
ncbi:DNA excision repair protein ERCC-8-like [Uloborus diversus]|uniref:DNA excision repair protein ERCC-8-like n=1 Tax=Uloborus diversus TaxID=327109 RepID=UPI00240A2689|nr:DNA excision repair protein ERCC-8-like [Uloborus diversus]